MTPVIPCSLSNVSLILGASFNTKRNNVLGSCIYPRKPRKQIANSWNFILPVSASMRLISTYGSRSLLRNPIGSRISAMDTDIALEEQDTPVAEKSDENSESNLSEGTENTETKSDSDPVPGRKTKSGRQSEMPSVKNEELVPGSTFTGKVRAIQPFGAFVDFGAFTDGLVHVSRLSDNFVKDVSSVVSIGQEVKVKLVEANIEAGRISLTMRENEGSPKRQPPKTAKKSTPKSNQKREDVKSSKFAKGQDLQGTVKNLARSGAFISLPDGEEGFLPTSEEADDGLGSMMGASSLQAGQEVSVRVLRISRGQVTLTMKKEVDNVKSDVTVSEGIVHTATNPFLLAFRKNKDIAMFLDEREEAAKEEALTLMAGSAASVEEKEEQNEGEEAEMVAAKETAAPMAALVETVSEEKNQSEKEAEIAANEENGMLATSSVDIVEEGILDQNVIVELEEAAKEGTAEEKIKAMEATTVEIVEEKEEEIKRKEDIKTDEGETVTITAGSGETLKEEIENNAEIQDSESREVKNEAEGKIKGISETPVEYDQSMETANDDKGMPENVVKAEQPEGNDTVSSLEANSDVPSQEEVNESTAVEEIQVPTPVANSTPDPSGKASISPALVKQLREETGAGMMDCKRALAETEGNIVKAQEYLRKKGLASADKKASRATAEGRIGSYIHDSRIGVLLEVNCETDFVSRGEIFRELVDDLAMQVAACPQVEYLVTEDVPEEIVNKEKNIEMQKEDLMSKPEQIREKIVEGRIKKRLEELALLEQPYIKNDKTVVKDWVKQTIATVGENIKVKRFVRFNLGEGLEKKSQDFAAEVAAQTTAKPSVEPKKGQPEATETKEAAEESVAVPISAALVKRLREETGAGMMDCKKALSETRGDLEKAQEYLRKKGLSTADKKSSRLAAEGRIGSYIHDCRIGVLIEVNCETDFVGRSEKFKELVDNLAMQVVACPQVQFVSIDEIPEHIVKKEKDIEMQREDILSKPENIREKIVEGRISKRLGELALLEQPYIKDDNLLVKDLVKQTIAAIGENIKVRRFVRFTLGELTEDEAKAQA